MAYNGMKVIHSGLAARIRYILNPDKTEGGSLCAGINTIPETVCEDMLNTKRRFGKLDKRQGYHIIQSFAPGEIAPEDALRFGMEFLERYLDGRFEAVAAVHTDKNHIHVHMIFNSVSLLDGKKFHAGKGEYLEHIREMCDEQCRAWGLSVIEGKPTITRTTKDEGRSRAQGKPCWRDILRTDIDQALQYSLQWADFIREMRRKGYAIKETENNLSMKVPGMKRFIRLKSLGTVYGLNDLKSRIRTNLRDLSTLRLEPVKYPSDCPPGDDFERYVGTQTYYYDITSQLRALMDKQNMRYAPELRAAIRNLDQWDEEMMFQEKYSIASMEDLTARQFQIQSIMDEITKRRDLIYRERRTAAAKASPERMKVLDESLQKYKSALASLRRDLRIANRVEVHLSDKVPKMLADREAQERIKQEMRQERTNRNRQPVR